MDARRDQRDDQAVADVLAELRALRLRLSADLAAASGALDTDESAVASDILAGGSKDLRRFVVDSRVRLEQELIEPATDDGATVHELPSARRRTGWRRALPAIPAVAVLAASAAAAAIVAPHIGQQEHRPSSARAVTMTSHRAAGHVAPAAFQQLRSAIIRHASAKEVLYAAQRWHQHLAALIASSKNDPHQLGVLISLLQQETQLLRSHHVPDAGMVLAAADRLEQHLLKTAAPLLSSLPTPATIAASQPSTSWRRHNDGATNRPFAASTRHSTEPSAQSSHSSPSHSTSPTPSPSPSGSAPDWSAPWQPSSPANGLFGKKS